MKSTKFWVTLLASLLLVSVAAAFVIQYGGKPGATAVVTKDGTELYRIDLTAVTAPYTIVISGAVENTVAVEQGRIRVLQATCPDQVCVHKGWISGGLTPIVCLPNALVITVENAALPEYDVLAQ